MKKQEKEIWTGMINSEEGTNLNNEQIRLLKVIEELKGELKNKENILYSKGIRKIIGTLELHELRKMEALFEEQTSALDALSLPIQRKTKKKKVNYKKFEYLLVVIPKSSREEFLADLRDIIFDMKKNNCSKIHILGIVSLHLISVTYHAFFFKLKGYFYSNAQQSNKD